MSVVGVIVIVGICLGLYAIGVPLFQTVATVVNFIIHHFLATLAILAVVAAVAAFVFGVV